MQKVLSEISQKKKQSKEAHEYTFGDDPMEIGENMDDVVEEINLSVQINEKAKGKRKSIEGINNYFAPRTTPGSQPSIKSVLAGKEAIKKALMAWARWFYDTRIPFNALQSPYFQLALDATSAIGLGYKDDNENIEELHTQDVDDLDVIGRFGSSSDLEMPQRFILIDEIDSDDN
ncbi:DUF659 domain-containing protein [Abeliophyllum distichum]|uniref:DUF659 domain-containing protein n=1 Tax=Abeliophyllum distichum TaxID=126358 RepID=A0ABD1RUE5_9LAMI